DFADRRHRSRREQLPDRDVGTRPMRRQCPMNRILALLVLASLAGLGSPAAAGEGKSKKKAEPAAEPAHKEGGAESDDPAERRRERLGRRSRSTSPDRPARRRTEPATPSEPVPAEDDPARSDDAPASPGTPET